MRDKVAAPLDALQTRFDVNEMLENRYHNVWRYAKYKLGEIGLRGVFAGYGFSLTKVCSTFTHCFHTYPLINTSSPYFTHRKLLDMASSFPHLNILSNSFSSPT